MNMHVATTCEDLKNCTNVCSHPEELYNSKPMTLQGETVSHILYLSNHIVMG